MKFKLGAVDEDANVQQKPMYRRQSSSSSSTYTYFTEQAIRAGFPSGNFGGGRHVGPELFQGRSDMREAIQRELEKEKIREEIIAEEMARMARKRLLEEEVRREFMMEREMMAMRSGGGFSSSFMPLSLPPSHHNLFDPRMPQGPQLGLEERIAMSLQERYYGGGPGREISGFEVFPFQRFGDSPKMKGIPKPLPEDGKKEIIVLDKPNGVTLSGTKRRSTPPASAASSELRSDSLKKLKEEWSCAICQVSATSEHGLNEHIQGKKHQAKEAALIAQKSGANFGLGVAPKKPIVKPVKLALTTVNPSSLENKSKIRKESVKSKPSMNNASSTFDSDDSKKEDGKIGEHKRDKFKFWCEMCQVGAFSEKVMNNHKKGKKHLTYLVELLQKGKVEVEAEAEAAGTQKTCDTEEKSEAETKKAVVVEVVAADVHSVKDETQDVTAVAADVQSVKDETQYVTAKDTDTLVKEEAAEVKTVKDDVEDVNAKKTNSMVTVDDMIKTGVAEDESI